MHARRGPHTLRMFVRRVLGPTTVLLSPLLPLSIPLRNAQSRMATALPENSVKELVGDGTTAESLLACKIGGCCGKDTPLLPLPAVHERLKAIPQWKLSEDQKVISRSFVAKNWAAAMSFLNAVSVIAEEEGHHPDLHLTGWRNVRVELSTHAIGGLSLPDLVLAAKMDAIPVEYSPKWLKEQQAQQQEQQA